MSLNISWKVSMESIAVWRRMKIRETAYDLQGSEIIANNIHIYGCDT